MVEVSYPRKLEPMVEVSYPRKLEPRTIDDRVLEPGKKGNYNRPISKVQ